MRILTRSTLIVLSLVVCGCLRSPAGADQDYLDAEVTAPDQTQPGEPLDMTLDARPEGDAARASDAAMDGDSQDAEVVEDMGVVEPPDAITFPPPIEPSPELECDGEDSDEDGLIDEGLSNLCGGCGDVPATGCQTWRINLIQDPNGSLNANRIVGLSGTLLSSEQIEIEGGVCDIISLKNREADAAHLGQVDLIGQRTSWSLTPTFDASRGLYRYGADDELQMPLFEEEERVNIVSEGGEVTPGMDVHVVAPEWIGRESPTGLEALIAKARGEASEESGPVGIRWTVAEQDTPNIDVYVGGSLVTFRPRPAYQAIQHFVLQGQLRDDGGLDLPHDFFGAGVPGSSVWAYLVRDGGRRFILGPHAVTVPIGRRFERRVSGGLSIGEEAPFEILTPDPSDPQFTVAQPLRVTWENPEEGEGPMVVRFASRNQETNIQTLVSCTPSNAAAGVLTLPIEITSRFSRGADDFNQLTLEWTIDARPLPGPDRGALRRSHSLILRFDD